MTDDQTLPVSIDELEAAIASIEAAPRPPQSADAPVVAQTPTTQTGSPLDMREYVDVNQLKKDVSFDLHDLDNAIRSHASLFVHYANLARLARAQADRMKAVVDVLESKLYAIHREALMSEGKKATEAQVTAAVQCDPRWMSAQMKRIDAKAIYDLANDAREAFAQRKDMLVQVSVDRRTEQQGEFRVNAARAVAEESRAGVLKHLAEQKASA